MQIDNDDVQAFGLKNKYSRDIVTAGSLAVVTARQTAFAAEIFRAEGKSVFII